MTRRKSRASIGRREWRLEDRVTPATQLLPDLFVHPSFLTGWYVATNPEGQQELRYTTAIANGGAGAFELNGTTTIVNNPDGTQSQVVNQKIYWDNGTTTSRTAGTFTYHPEHGHLHFDHFTSARLRLRPVDQSIGGIVADGEKISFCLIDSNRYDGSLPGSPATAQYLVCGPTVQGVSVGWTDVYAAELEGQSINITGVPNGNYWFEVSVDPEGQILETNETNNITRIPITLTAQPSYGFRVLAATPLGPSNDAVSSATLTFNQSVSLATVSAADLVLLTPSGKVPVTSITALDDTNLRINFAPQTQVGTYTMTLLPSVNSKSGALLDQNNNGVGGEQADEYRFVFTIPAPRIDLSSPNAGTAAPVNHVRITYNKPIVSSTLTAADIVSFTGPGGVNLLGTVTGVTPIATGGTSSVLDVMFKAASTPGIYKLVIGSNVSDSLNHLADQNLDGSTNVADNYTASFAISAPGTVGPDPFGYTAAIVTPPTGSIVGRPGVFTLVTGTDDSAVPVRLLNNAFTFYGTTYTGPANVWASTNGLITFGTSAGNHAFVNDDLQEVEFPTIAVLWDDWNKGTGVPQMLALLEDTNADTIADRLIIEWNQVSHTSPGPSDTGVSFQAILELNTGARPGSIVFNYLDLDANNVNYSNGASATVGIHSPGEDGPRLLISQDSATNTMIRSGKALQFTVPRVLSITRLDSTPNGSGAGRFQVSFSEGVIGVDPTDFALTNTGTVNGIWVDSVTPTVDPRVWQVHFQWFSGAGTIGLRVLDNDTITNLYGARLAGFGFGTGEVNASPIYTVTNPLQQRVVVGADAGGGPHVRAMKANTGEELFSFFAFDASFRGGVRVAQGDVNGDGVPDIIVAAGPGGGPHVKVYDGRDLTLLRSFFAFGAGFTGGVWIAVGDVNNDGFDDIIAGADAGGGPHVRVFSGANGSELMSFFAYGSSFTGGVRVGAGDVDGDHRVDIITGAGPGGGPHVKVFSGANGSTLRSFFPYATTFTGGVFVAGGDVNNDGFDDIVTGAGAGGGPHVKVYSSTGQVLLSYLAFPPALSVAGVRVGCDDINSDGRADLLLAPGVGDVPLLEVRDALNLTLIKKMTAFDPAFLGGVFVG